MPPCRVGSSLQWGEDQGLKDFSGAGHAHQLPGTPSHRVGNEIIPQGSQRCDCSVAAGQLDSCSIHQQLEGHSIPSPHHHGQITLAVGPGQRHNALSTTHPRSAEHYSRPGIQSGEEQVRLDALSSSVQESLPDSGASGGRPVRLTADSPIATILQLETRPTGGSSRCISTGLGPVEGVCQSSVVLSGTCVEQGEITRGSTGPSGSSMERPVLVSRSSWNAEGFSPPPVIIAGANAEGGQQRTVQFTLQLAVWPVSGRNLETAAFQQMLQTSCWRPGGRSPPKPMTPYSTNGLAGVLNGIVIPFLAL